jgi:hypothetical protein
MQWSANATEHAHVQEIKNPARMGNNQNYYNQIAQYLDRSDKCMCFNLATYLETRDQMNEATPHMENDNIFDQDDTNIDDVTPLSHLELSRSTINYFSIADFLAHGCVPDAPKPYRTFATSTTAFHITIKPSLHVGIDEAATLFGIPDLCPAIRDFLQCIEDKSGHPMTSTRTQDLHCPLPFDRVQVWYKLHLQQFLYHGNGKVDVPL